MNAAAPLLGQLLTQQNLITAADLAQALSVQQQIGGRLGAILVRVGAISEDNLLITLEKQLGMPLLNGAELPILDNDRRQWLLSHAPRDWWLDQGVIAWETAHGLRAVARDPLDPLIDEFLQRWGSVEWCLIRNHDLSHLLDQLDDANQTSDEVGQLRELALDAPVIEFVNNLLAQGIEQQASDIHVEPQERRLIIRFRIDGALYERLSLPKERHSAICSRLKLIAGLDIAERRLPQDGKLRTRVGGMALDIRVSSLPGVHGESIVLRLLPVERRELSLNHLGLDTQQLQQWQQLIHQPHGILLVTGPTGSGKSTTLYAALGDINDGRRKIITVEDPVEYQMTGITQVQIQSDIGYTFARALRSILRQDPDVIMIGEIRDLETAEIAVRAALTGHLMLSTLHTNDAVGAFTRLIDMGLEPFLVANPSRGVMAQRLVRRLCSHCSEPVAENLLLRREIEPFLTSESGMANWREAGKGCHHCRHTGYSGRVGIYELVMVTTDLQRIIVHDADAQKLWQQAVAQGSRSLRQDGLLKAYRGITSVSEVLKVTSDQA